MMKPLAGPCLLALTAYCSLRRGSSSADSSSSRRSSPDSCSVSRGGCRCCKHSCQHGFHWALVEGVWCRLQVGGMLMGGGCRVMRTPGMCNSMQAMHM